MVDVTAGTGTVQIPLGAVVAPMTSRTWKPGTYRIVGNQIWGICAACGTFIRVKRFIGTLHLCVSDDEPKTADK